MTSSAGMFFFSNRYLFFSVNLTECFRKISKILKVNNDQIAVVHKVF